MLGDRLGIDHDHGEPEIVASVCPRIAELVERNSADIYTDRWSTVSSNASER
jgi:hypothetical protein